jgi:ketosteroid isomerase-like protein
VEWPESRFDSTQAALCASLAPMSTSSQTISDQLRQSMADTNSLFNTEVFGNRNFDVLDKIYTSNATILPPGAPMISGRAAIKEFWSSVVASINGKSAVLTSVNLTETMEGVVEIGKATLTVQPKGQSLVEMDIKYVVYWRQEDGLWKWHIDIWNTNA